MMNIKKYISITFLLVFWIISVSTTYWETLVSPTNISVSATDKDSILNEITTLSSQINSLKDTKTTSLKNKVLPLSESYDKIFEDLWYDESVKKYLISLWELGTDYKSNLIEEYKNLNNEIINKCNTQLLVLENLKSDINLSYSSLTQTAKEKILSDIKEVKGNYTDLEKILNDKISNLETIYNWYLWEAREEIESSIEANKSKLDSIADFDKSFEDMLSDRDSLVSQFNTFKSNYLTYAWELSSYIDEKRNTYVDYLEKQLTNIVDLNLEANPPLVDYVWDFDRVVDIWVENFGYKLNENLSNKYNLLYNYPDINIVLGKIKDLETKYYDVDGNPRASEISSNTWSIKEISDMNNQLDKILSDITTFLNESDTDIKNVKIQIENNIIGYYNDNYKKYKDDVMSKIKEKIQILSLENRSVVTISEIINIKYELLWDEIWNIRDLSILEEKINNFKTYLVKYEVLENEELENKMQKINYLLDVYLLQKILDANEMYNYKHLTQWYQEQIKVVLAKLDNSYNNEERFYTKMQSVIIKIDNMLSTDISIQIKYLLINIKLAVVDYMWEKNWY